MLATLGARHLAYVEVLERLLSPGPASLPARAARSRPPRPARRQIAAGLVNFGLAIISCFA